MRKRLPKSINTLRSTGVFFLHIIAQIIERAAQTNAGGSIQLAYPEQNDLRCAPALMIGRSLVANEQAVLEIRCAPTELILKEGLGPL